MRERFSGLPPYLSVRRFVYSAGTAPAGTRWRREVPHRRSLPPVRFGRTRVVLDNARDFIDLERAWVRVQQTALDGCSETLHPSMLVALAETGCAPQAG